MTNEEFIRMMSLKDSVSFHKFVKICSDVVGGVATIDDIGNLQYKVTFKKQKRPMLKLRKDDGG